MSNGLASRKQGDFAGTITVKTVPNVDYLSVKDSYQFTITLTGASPSKTGFLKAGDQLKFTSTHWLNQQSKQTLYNGSTAISFTATMLEDADSNVSDDVTVKLSGALICDGRNQHSI